MSDHRAATAKLLADLAQQIEAMRTTYEEGRGAWQNKLLVQLGYLVSAAGAGGRALEASPELAEAAQALAQAQADFAKQTVQAGRHLRALAEGWACKRCGATAPASARLPQGPDKGLPQLECRACGALTEVSEAGAKAFEQRFGHLTDNPGWNPETNGFGRL